MKADGSWRKSESEISKEGDGFFEKQFTGGIIDEDMSLLQFIQPLISQEDNAQINDLPDESEIKKVIFEV